MKRKTNKAIRKRIKITGRKKVMSQKTKRRHLLGDRSASKKRQFRGWHALEKTQGKVLMRQLPYG